MITQNEILIHAPAEKIYALASATTNWPNILPHYRFVRSLAQEGNTSTVMMGAYRDWIPVSWTAEQINIPHIPEVRFTHVRGWTKGMDVVWRFLPENGATRVVIEHALEFRFPFFGGWIGEHIIGKFFVENIANKTLARMKFLTEGA